MDTVYIILHKYGGAWDDQTLYRTNSKALFEFLKSYHNNKCPYYDKFTEELKADIHEAYECQKLECPEITPSELDEEMSINEAMEWLDAYGCDYHKFPAVLGGTAEFYSFWNW